MAEHYEVRELRLGTLHAASEPVSSSAIISPYCQWSGTSQCCHEIPENVEGALCLWQLQVPQKPRQCVYGTSSPGSELFL
jgi:hypothetical protein